MHTILKYSSQVIGELQQMNGQLQATSHFLAEMASHMSKAAAQVRDRSDESKEMMQKLRKLNVETSLLKVNALENLENQVIADEDKNLRINKNICPGCTKKPTVQ